MGTDSGFVDIHCHLLPGIDDGAASWDVALSMARMAVDDGICSTIVTPHQLGAFSQNRGADVRRLTSELQRKLDAAGIPMSVRPGADVRIEPEMVPLLRAGDVLSLADHRKHVLLELPHEIYFPVESVLSQLESAGMVGVLSHPERNQGILANQEVVLPLVERGCLMQVTAGSLTGTFGSASRRCAESLLQQGLVHFIASDAHGTRSRRPLLTQAFARTAELCGEQTADELFKSNPQAVFDGGDVTAGRRTVATRKRRWYQFS